MANIEYTYEIVPKDMANDVSEVQELTIGRGGRHYIAEAELPVKILVAVEYHWELDKAPAIPDSIPDSIVTEPVVDGSTFTATSETIFDDGINYEQNQWALVIETDSKKEILHLNNSQMVYFSDVIGKGKDLMTYLRDMGLYASAPNIPSNGYNNPIYGNNNLYAVKMLFARLTGTQNNMINTTTNPTFNREVEEVLGKASKVVVGHSDFSFILTPRGITESRTKDEYLKISDYATLTLQTGRHSIKTSNGINVVGTIDEINTALSERGMIVIVNNEDNTMKFVNFNLENVLIEISAEGRSGKDYVPIEQDNTSIVTNGKSAQFILRAFIVSV